MSKALLTRSTIRVRSHDAFERWHQRCDSYLDRVEEFASNFGGEYARKLDGVSIALGVAMAALVMLALS